MSSRGLRRYHLLQELLEFLTQREGVIVEIARDLLQDITLLTWRINDIERRLGKLVRASHPALLEVPGLGVLGVATIIGETAGAGRFTNKGVYARFNGTASIPVWSGNKVCVRLSRGGNRRINTALHTAEVTQARGGLRLLRQAHRLRQDQDRGAAAAATAYRCRSGGVACVLIGCGGAVGNRKRS